MNTVTTRHFYHNKYYMRVMISITLVAVVLIGSLSAVMYLYGKQYLFSIQSQHNEQVLNQAKFNIELMSTSVQNVAQYLFVNPDTTYILNSVGNLDSDEIYSRINRIAGTVLTSNSFIHSIGLYNDYRSQYYYVGKQLYYNDEGLKRLIGSYPKLPRMIPIFRTIDNQFGDKIVKEPVITYMLYETSGDPAVISSAVAINVNSDWMIDNIKQISMLNEQAGEVAYVYSDTSGFLDTGVKDDGLRESLLDAYRNNKNPDDVDFGSSEMTLKNKTYVVSYMKLKDLGLTIFKVQPSELIYKYLHTFSLYLLVIFGVFLVVALLFSMKVSGIVYNPIRRLVNLAADGNGHTMERDEIAFLSSVYKTSRDRLQKYDNRKLDYNHVLRDYFIKSLLTDEVNRQKFADGCQEYGLQLQYDSDYYAFVVKFDDFGQLQSRYSPKDISLYKYAAINIFAEIVRDFGTALGVSLNEDDAMMMLELRPGGPVLDERTIETMIRRYRETVGQYYPVSFTISASRRVTGIQRLPIEVRHTYNLSAYRFLFGKGSLITSERVMQNKENPRHTHSPKWETILLDNLRQGSFSGMQQAFDHIRAELVQMSYENALSSFMHVMTAIYNELFASGRIAPSGQGSVISHIWKSLSSYETLDDAFQSILGSLERLFQQTVAESSTDQNVAEAAIDIILLKYTENALCADQIADSLGMNARRLTKTFKQAIGMSIADYLNGVRMEKAAELLRSSKLSVNEILLRVGYENESYFYRMFKSRYGMTPKEFAQRTK